MTNYQSPKMKIICMNIEKTYDYNQLNEILPDGDHVIGAIICVNYKKNAACLQPWLLWCIETI